MFGQFLLAAGRRNAEEKAVLAADLSEFTGGSSRALDVVARCGSGSIVDFDEAALGCEKVIRLSGNDADPVV